MRISRIKETCLYVADLQATRDFYEGIMGLECFALREGRHAFFRAGESVLLCFISEATKEETNLPPHYGSGKLHFAFECPPEEYEEWKDRMQNAGVEIIHEQEWGEGIRSFYFHDPDGHVAEIVVPGLWD